MIRIAIVEDEYPVLMAFQKLIERLSSDYHIVRTASNVHDGLLLIKNHKPDLVFCDIKLGKESGLDMIETLIVCGVNCRYVILSGYSEFSYAQQAIRLGVIDYLVKPTSAKQISQLLKTFAEEMQEKEQPEPKATSEFPYSQVIAYTLKRIHNSYASALNLNIMVRRSRQSGVARATCPD